MTEYLTSENVEAESALDIGEYPLPYKPEIVVRVQSVTMARMKQYMESNGKGGAVAAAADKAIISESIINPDGSRVYKTAEQVESLLKGKTRLVLALIAMIRNLNGDSDKLQADAEKKSEPAD